MPYTDFQETNHVWMPVEKDGRVQMVNYDINNMIAGDTDSVTGDTEIYVNGQKTRIDDYYERVSQNSEFLVNDPFNHNYVISGRGDTTLSYDGDNVNSRQIRYVMKHRVKKEMFRITVDGKSVEVTNDHSLVVRRKGALKRIKPSEICASDFMVFINSCKNSVETSEFTAEPIGTKEQFVYDVEVDEDHNFFANDILVHNSAYLKLDPVLTDGKSSDEIVEMCDKICAEANSEFADYCKTMFNCPTERSWTVAADREAVSDKSWFLTKKRYVMHVINMEGEEVDELKLMGLEIKKSDTPPIVKRILQDMVEMILDGTTREKLKQRLQEWKAEYYNADLHDIGKPSGCKTLKKAYDQLQETGDLKGIHYASRAAIFYNSLCQKKDRRVRFGDKISIVYINHADSKYIGFPTDAEMLPEWLTEDIIVDYDANWKLADKKITNYLETLGWDITSMNNQIRQDLFGF